MAAANHLRDLKQEATCSICLGYFTDPVSAECGHAFCFSCITRCGEGVQNHFPCPQCRAVYETKTLRPNRHLANMVEIAKHLQVPSATPHGINRCRKHEEKWKLFCVDDQEPICVVCSMSGDHKTHKMLPILEAAQEYKEKCQRYRVCLKEKWEYVLELHCKEETKVTQLEAKLKSQKAQVINEFEKLQRFLEREKSRRLSNLKEEGKKELHNIKEAVTTLEEQQRVLRRLITDLDWKCQQQEVELLNDVKVIFFNSDYHIKKSENMKAQRMDGDKLKKKEETDLEKDVDLERKILESLEWRWARRFAAEVTLDPDTAHRVLILSSDGRSVRLGDGEQYLPYSRQRFHPGPIVLGRERLSAGRHYWEVEVGDKTHWILGVCDESVSRKGEVRASPEKGYWTMGLTDSMYIAGTSPSILLTPRVHPKVVGLFLDYEAGRLSAYNVDDRSLLFTFPGVSFPPTLRPFFCTEGDDGGRNAKALRILAVKGQQ
ncbi:E3 ubiquitin-protein ligase TRIM11-like [Lissotriton helveticus]